MTSQGKNKRGAARGWASGAFALTLATMLAAPMVSADDRAKVVEMRAERLAEADRCDEVVTLVAGAPESARNSASLLRLKANCEVELGRYADAIATAKSAKAADPKLEDVDLLLGVALYHDGQMSEAGEALDAARGNTSRAAELDLYTGLILLQRQETREAALALERARRANPEAVEPAASYYAALAWQAERDGTRANAALDRVRASDPSGNWAGLAEESLGGAPAKPWWVTLMAGLEYDDNVVLRTSQLPAVSNDDDGRGVWSVDLGARLFETGKWSGGVLGSYYGSAHFDQNEFDLHYPSAGAWLDYQLNESTVLRGRYDYGYAWIDYDPFLGTHRPQVSMIHRWDAGSTELFVGGEFNDFKPASSTGPFDRDGEGVNTGIVHRMPVFNDKASVRGGYTYSRYWADGSEWDYDAHRFHLGGAVAMPWDMTFDTEGSYSYRPHEDTSLFPDPDGSTASASGKRRRDHLWLAHAELSKPITERTTISARYGYTHSNSNSGFFDYDRHVVGGYVTVDLP